MRGEAQEGSLLASRELVRRVIAAEAGYTLSRLEVLRRLPGNPIGIAWQQVETGLTATMAQYLPGGHFNAVKGLEAGHGHHPASLAAWYRDAGVKGQFEVVPGMVDAALLNELRRLGLSQTGFHTVLIGSPRRAVSDVSHVERVTTPAAMEAFLDAYVAGRQIPHADQFKANVRPWLEQPGWHLYLARVAGKSAAAAILYVRDGVGYCADAATDPAFRNLGLQRALLERRIADTHAVGADLVCSGADFLTSSHRNMERVGLRVAFTRALWQEA